VVISGRASRVAVVSAALAALAVLLFLVSLGIGPVPLSPAAVARALAGFGPETDGIIVREIRLPRAILSVTIGAVLGLSGAALQGLLRNPLAAPSLFGAPQAAAFGAVATLSLGIADALSYALPVAAIAGAFLSVFLLLAVAGRRAGLTLLILAGLAGVEPRRGRDGARHEPRAEPVRGARDRVLAARLARGPLHAPRRMAAPFMAVGAILLFANRAAFRALTLGEDSAQSLGIRVSRLRLVTIAGVALGVGSAVAVAGTIGFIGLVAPHLVRPLVGYDPARSLLPAALAGACLLTAADIAVRIIPSTTDIKVGVLTAIIGVPFFLYLIARERRRLGAGLVA
jgi:iron complex transport system permease protein